MSSDHRFLDPDFTVPQPWDRLAAHLAGHGLVLDLGVAPRQFATGLANQNYRVSINGEMAVLRRPPPGPMAEGANDMGREYRVLSRLGAAYSLAPKGLYYCEDTDVLGAPFQLIEFRDGVAIGSRLPEPLAARGDAGQVLTGALVEAMTTLHAVDPEAVGLGRLGRPDGFLGRQVEGWGRRAHAAYPDDPPAEIDVIVGWLRKQVPASSRSSLLHNDFKFDNMLFELEPLRSVAVVDWDMCTLGEPLFDLAVLLSYWPDHDDPPGIKRLDQVPSLEPGFPGRGEVTAAYFEAAGRRPEDLSFLLVLTRFRLAIVWAQLYNLHLRGASNNPKAGGFGEISRELLAWIAGTLDAPPT
jgi:aminoglycoside phosphotransferase (APT) family kinase protein